MEILLIYSFIPTTFDVGSNCTDFNVLMLCPKQTILVAKILDYERGCSKMTSIENWEVSQMFEVAHTVTEYLDVPKCWTAYVNDPSF
jgi:hypothetical protein